MTTSRRTLVRMATLRLVSTGIPRVPLKVETLLAPISVREPNALMKVKNALAPLALSSL